MRPTLGHYRPITCSRRYHSISSNGSPDCELKLGSAHRSNFFLFCYMHSRFNHNQGKTINKKIKYKEIPNVDPRYRSVNQELFSCQLQLNHTYTIVQLHIVHVGYVPYLDLIYSPWIRERCCLCLHLKSTKCHFFLIAIRFYHQTGLIVASRHAHKSLEGVGFTRSRGLYAKSVIDIHRESSYIYRK